MIENSDYKNINTPKISIITVVYNSASTLEKTIRSIINQTYKNIEYIIIDGASADGTLDIIKKYKSNISHILSEPDKGLYDAMNKGLTLATGNYVWFINSGDQIFAADTVSLLIENIADKNLPDILYGETDIIDGEGNIIGARRLKAPEKLTAKSFKNGMLVCHQSIIVKRSIADKYDLKYRHSADFDWVVKALKKAHAVTNSHMILSKFLDGGQSKQNIAAGLKERFKIMKENYGLLPTLWQHVFIGIKFAYFVLRHKRF